MKNNYTPRRASKTRWLDGAPAHVLDCFKNDKCGTFDVIYTGVTLIPQDGRTFANTYVFGREMSENPSHPQGVGLSFELKAREAAAYRYRNGRRRIKWQDLPPNVKQCAIRDGETE